MINHRGAAGTSQNSAPAASPRFQQIQPEKSPLAAVQSQQRNLEEQRPTHLAELGRSNSFRESLYTQAMQLTTQVGMEGLTSSLQRFRLILVHHIDDVIVLFLGATGAQKIVRGAQRNERAGDSHGDVKGLQLSITLI